MTPELVLSAFLSLPSYVGDRGDSVAAREKLLRPYAEAVADVSRENRWKAAALIALMWHESRLARYVLEGRCQDGPRGARCDPGRDGVARARGATQVWAWCTEAWAHPAGSLGSIRGEVACASRRLSGGLRACRGRHPAGDTAGALSYYKAGACRWQPAARRARTVDEMLYRLTFAARPRSPE